MTELKKFILRESYEILSDRSAIVFVEALQGNFRRLRDIAREIDEEYSSEPSPNRRTRTPIYAGCHQHYVQ
jgi:hypothetical protein